MAPQAMRWGPLAVRRSARPHRRRAGGRDGGVEGARSTSRSPTRWPRCGGCTTRWRCASRCRWWRWSRGAIALARDAERAADDVAAARPQALRPVHHHARLHVSVLAMALAERMGWAGGRCGASACGAAARHRKTRIPHEILVKPGKLTEAERHVMQQHPWRARASCWSRSAGWAWRRWWPTSTTSASTAPATRTSTSRGSATLEPHRARLRHLRCALQQPAVPRGLGLGARAELPRVARGTRWMPRSSGPSPRWCAARRRIASRCPRRRRAGLSQGL